ncbi:unnamed protein product [Caretta caretta]
MNGDKPEIFLLWGCEMGQSDKAPTLYRAAPVALKAFGCDSFPEAEVTHSDPPLKNSLHTAPSTEEKRLKFQGFSKGERMSEVKATVCLICSPEGNTQTRDCCYCC